MTIIEPLYRKVLKICAEDSPNVRLGLRQKELGRKPSGIEVVPGVLSWHEYCKRRQFWSPMRQTIGLDAQFPEEGALMFPSELLKKCIERHKELLERRIKRRAIAIGVDCAEGGDKTSICIGDEFGVIELVAQKTPNTAVIPGLVRGKMRDYKILASRVVFDRGGGGYEHADILRADGLNVRTVGFGESASPELKPRPDSFKEKIERHEERYVYANRRVQMYHQASLLCEKGYGIPKEMEALHQQLSMLPKEYDQKGKGIMTLPDKGTLYGDESPDEADSFALMVFGLQNQGLPNPVRVMF